ncbi:MAG: phospholipid scramblase-related protein [Acidimicrobiales bacterium]
MTQQEAPFAHPSTTPATGGGARRKGRPAFGLLVVVTGSLRFGREIIERVAFSRFGFVGMVAVVATVVLLILLWRAGMRRRVRSRGGLEFTPELVAKQIADSGIGPPAFAEDGTLLGASVLVVNQRSKILEVNTEYEVFGSSGRPLGAIRQIGQSRRKSVARIVTPFDQYFTHHFEILGTDGRPLLRLTRPRKIFLTKVHVFDGDDRFVGTIRQQNVFWKIRFELRDGDGGVVGHLRAENLRAWDFNVYDRYERVVATVVKSWEGWARTAFTRADRYAVRIHEPLHDPLRQLTIATALAADLALKQDARGIL